MGTMLKPRLDIAFKSKNRRAPRKPLSEIRQHWQHFIDYYATKHDLEVIEYLLTEITPKIAARYDNPYVPHRGERDGYKNCMFYMQTVFPHIFSVDRTGWGGDLSFLPVGTEPCEDVFPEFQRRIDRNESFFWQPPRQDLEPFDIFFACQLPHDLNVVQQSDTGVHEALDQTLRFAKQHGLRVVAKGHPIQGNSAYSGACQWSDASIHDLISAASAVVTVNSGVGMESVLHETPVYAFGKANYSEVAAPSLEEVFDWKPDYRGFFNQWYAHHEDYTRGD